MGQETLRSAASVAPSEFFCPISLEIMRDPVTLCTGQTYERESIQKWFDNKHRSCPCTMQNLSDVSLTPNHTLRQLIEEWTSQQRSIRDGPIEFRLKRLKEKLVKAKDQERVIALQAVQAALEKQESLRESFVLRKGVELLISLLGPLNFHAVNSEIVSILSCLSLDNEAKRALGQPAKLSLIVDLLREGSLQTQEEAAKLLRALFVLHDLRAEIGTRVGVLFGLKRLMRAKEKPSALLAAVDLLRSMVNSCVSTRNRAVEMEFVGPLVDLIAYSKPKCVELALSILHKLRTTTDGREALRSESSTIPNLIGVMIRVSEICTQYALSILRTMFSEAPEEVAMRAVDAGLAEKLLMVIQSGCTSAIKQKSVELLKVVSKGSVANTVVGHHDPPHKLL